MYLVLGCFSGKQWVAITELYYKDCYLDHAFYFQSQASTRICKVKLAFKLPFFTVKSSKLDSSVVWASVCKINHKYVHSLTEIISISSKYFWCHNNKQKVVNQYKSCLKRTWTYIEDMFYFCSGLYWNFQGFSIRMKYKLTYIKQQNTSYSDPFITVSLKIGR